MSSYIKTDAASLTGSLAGSGRFINELLTGKEGAPNPLDAFTEMPRLMAELSCLSLSWPSLVRQAPEGDGHPVLVVPGFTTGDESTLVLRRFLTRLGYHSLPWLQGTNTGNPKVLEGIIRRFYRLHQSFDCPISLVGHSLGGVFAREIARQFPDAVRCVITLGSPYAATSAGTTNPLVEKLFEQMSGLTIEQMRAQVPVADESEELGIPATSIFSKQDGVVGWRTCIEPETDLSESIQVSGSHVGLAMNPATLRVIANRLAQDPSSWSKYSA